ncbi:MAG TPA: nucleotide exchange factor GrpE [Thermoanaerobaculia bacterium]|jgi:molecular chaperone GrpE|nr:nucleotide exchange factor GrpE [Thermoanaerobaculia bacterium]
MADEEKKNAADTDVAELDLDGGDADLESALRDAVAAVEGVESGAAPEADAADAGNAATGDDVGKLRREIADLRDRSMRTLADFDNFRKRSERERQEAKRYALLEPLRDFLAVVDNLERALSAQGSAEDLKRGVEMTLRQFQEQLRRHGVKEVPAKGAAFDPALHEAVSRQEDPTVDRPTVVEELQRGYMMHERLLRPAMVKVAVPAEKPAPAPAGGTGGISGNGGIPVL